jgi:hypothetical protein
MNALTELQSTRKPQAAEEQFLRFCKDQIAAVGGGPGKDGKAVGTFRDIYGEAFKAIMENVKAYHQMMTQGCGEYGICEQPTAAPGGRRPDILTAVDTGYV